LDDGNQLDVPPSFTALFTTPGGYKLTEPLRVVRERYELCEDMAQMLTEQASAAQFKTGASESEVLAGVQQALSAEGGPLGAAEARWVATRIAELLGWPMPAQSAP
jgi:hypothetical protein